MRPAQYSHFPPSQAPDATQFRTVPAARRARLPVIMERRKPEEQLTLEQLDQYGMRARALDVEALHLFARLHATWSGVWHPAVEKNDVSAVTELMAAANAGHANSQLDLGFCYANGSGVIKDARRANVWFRMAAGLGNADAKLNLAISYASGNGVEVNRDVALHCLTEAANAGSILAQHWLGLCHLIGCGVGRDIDLAFQYFMKAAAKGYAPSQCMLGYLCETQTHTRDNLEQAAAWFSQAASAGDVTAQCQLAGMYASGRGVAPDRRNAEWLYENAALGGSALGAYMTGATAYDRMPASGSRLHEVQKAKTFWGEAADRGHSGAQLRLGRLYLGGQDVTRDLERAFELILSAARNGEVLAAFTVALMYSQGKGVAADNAEAEYWWNLAASHYESGLTFDYVRNSANDHGTSQAGPVFLAPLIQVANRERSGPADFLAGLAYELGVDVESDFELARFHYHRSANSGNASARYRLGCIYADYPQLVSDDHDAAYWLSLAAGQGHAEAQARLALLYRFGSGVERNDAEAKSLLQLSAVHSETGKALFGELYLGDGREPRQALSDLRFLSYNSPISMYLLGCRYAVGDGVERDSGRAKMLWAKAAAHGHIVATRLLAWPIL